MSMSKITTTMAVLLSAVVLTACGGSASSGSIHASNANKVQQARSYDAEAASVHGKLDTALRLRAYAGVPDAFMYLGGWCAINDIQTAQDASVYDVDSVLLSPDNHVAVNVDHFEGTAASLCMEAVRNALKW